MKISFLKIIPAVTFAFASFLFFATSAYALTNVYLDPGEGVYGEGSTFSTKIRIDPRDECINAVDITLSYPPNSIKAIDVARGESIMTLWPVEPTIDDEAGTVHFTAGIPGGYCGRVEGDPGFTNVLADVIFQVPGFTVGPKGPDDGEIVFSQDSQVLISDGFGTPADVVYQNASFQIVPPGEGSGSQDWFKTLSSDQTQPEPFTIQLVRDETVFDGKWYIVWNSTDKQSGIDHYEVYETDRENKGFVVGKKPKQAQWVRGSSPYVLTDQTLNSLISVKAIDKAGNERLATKIPDEGLRVNAPKSFNTTYVFVIVGIVVVLLLAGVFLIFRKKKKELSDTIKHELEEEYGEQLPQENEFLGNDAPIDTGESNSEELR
jgi:LPXTG-motif cell wall-anchored protein